MFNPVGSLPPKIYWRRRVIAGVVCGLALLLLWALFGGGEKPHSTKSVAAQQVSSSAGSSTSSTLQLASPSSSPQSDGVVPGLGAAAQLTDGKVKSPSHKPKETAKPSESPKTPPSPTTCPDKSLRLAAGTSQPSYPAAAEPTLTLEIQNISDRACFRDLGAKAQELTVFQGDKRMWSSDDCFTGGESDVRTLAPKQSAKFSLHWSGLTSNPGCAANQRVRVKPGDYTVVARLDKIKSKPTKFSMK